MSREMAKEQDSQPGISPYPNETGTSAVGKQHQRISLTGEIRGSNLER